LEIPVVKVTMSATVQFKIRVDEKFGYVSFCLKCFKTVWRLTDDVELMDAENLHVCGRLQSVIQGDGAGFADSET